MEKFCLQGCLNGCFLLPGQDKGNGCALILFFYNFLSFFDCIGSLLLHGLFCSVECWGYPPVAVHELLTVMASLAAQPRL